MRKIGFLGAVAGALLLAGAGCAVLPGEKAVTSGSYLPSQPAPSQETGPIKMGWIGPLTGDAAVYGEPAKKVTALAVEQINQAGGVNGRQLEVVYEDGKCDGKEATNAMQKLVNVDKVQFVIGGFCSGEALAAAPIANDNKVVLLSPSASSPDLTTKGGPFFFRDYPSDASQGKVLAGIAVEKGWKKVAVMQEQTDYALGVHNAFSEAFTQSGGTVSAEQFASDATDFRSTLTKLKAMAPDALLVSVQTPKVAGLVLQQVKELGWKVPLMGDDVIPASDMPKKSPQLIEGMITAEFGYDKDSQKFKDFVAAYKTKYNADVPYLSYAQTEYDAPFVLVEALKAVGTDTDKVREYLHTIKDWQGVSGAVSFDEHGDRTVGHRAEVIKGGQVMVYIK